MRQLTDADIRAVTDRMNATPRKCLGWRTPGEVFAENMMEIAGPKAYSRAIGKSHFM
jgi:IS30 family transposase